ncbi:MAG: PadR family transcriptional regulator [Streptomyces albidoflavus]
MTWNPDTTGGRSGRNRRGGHKPYDAAQGLGPSHESRRRHHPGRRDEFDGPRPGGGPRGGGRGGRGGDLRGGRRGSRGRRRDVRGAVLTMLAVEPMHGYQLMQAIAERSNGRWSPSPGAVYPVLSQLEDEGLATVADVAGRKVATLTEAGRTAAAEVTDPFSQDDDAPAGPDLRDAVAGLHVAAREVGRSGTRAQQERAHAVIDEARRALYLLLAEAPDGDSPAEQ